MKPEDIPPYHCIKCNKNKNLVRISILKDKIYTYMCLDCKGKFLSICYRARKLKNNNVPRVYTNASSLSTTTKHFALDLDKQEREKIWQFFKNYNGNFNITNGVIKKVTGIE